MDIVLCMLYFCIYTCLIFYFYPQIILLLGTVVLTITNTTIKSYKLAGNITLTAIKNILVHKFTLDVSTIESIFKSFETHLTLRISENNPTPVSFVSTCFTDSASSQIIRKWPHFLFGNVRKFMFLNFLMSKLLLYFCFRLDILLFNELHQKAILKLLNI